MKYLSILLFVIIGLGCVNSYAQDAEKQNRISLKLYSQIMAKGTGQTNNLSIGFSPAVSLATKRGDFHELEINNFKFNRDKYNNETSSFNREIGFRYSFNYSINKEGKFKAYLGAGFNSNLQTYKFKYRYIEDVANPITGEYKENKNEITLNITPRVIWDISDKWFLDVNIPVDAYNLSNSVIKTDDVQSKITNSSSTTFPNKYTVNVGVGFKF